MASKRDYRLDNIRGALIFLVVFCHLLVELPHGPLVGVLYQVVYLFHMPAFVFVTGYFARFRPQRIAAGLLLPYVVFQVISIVRRNLVAGRVWFVGMTLLYPQWTLWYLLACVLWYVTIPLLDKATTRRTQTIVVAAGLVLSVVCGFAPWLGEFMDLARVVALFPFFAAGYYAGRHRLSERIDALGPAMLRRVRLASVCAVGVLTALHYLHGSCPAYVLYRDTPFASMWDFEARVLVQLVAAAWCLMLMVCAPQRDLGFVSVAGRNTMSVYLLHPWVIRVLRHVPPLPGSELFKVAVCAVVAAIILVALGNDRVGTAFRYVFAGGWLKKTSHDRAMAGRGQAPNGQDGS
ncbi:MAG: acyltransferase family protein [Coriobacteriales bacterium]|nr:acyltransferase family protein [Coriobacteriales bacterium]